MFPPITSGIVAFWLVYVLSFTNNRWHNILPNKFVQIWLAYYLLLILGLLYTTNTAEASKDIVLKISLILWPVGFASWQEPILKYRDKILLVFACTTVASCLVTLLVGSYLWFNSGTDLGKIFIHLNIWDTLPNHYIALYCTFSIFVLAHFIIRKKVKTSWAASGIIVMLLFISFISVRIQFIAIPVATILFLVFTKTKVNKKKLWQFAISGCILIGVLAFAVPSSRTRILESVDEFKSLDGMVNSKQTNHRVFLWSYGGNVIKENFWLGTGTGAADDALNEELKTCKAKFWNGHSNYYLYEDRYNFHNAYLQQFATHGILGVLILISLFILPFVLLKNKLTGLQAAFLGACAISFITESMLERQAGVLFFGFFYALLFVPNEIKSGK